MSLRCLVTWLFAAFAVFGRMPRNHQRLWHIRTLAESLFLMELNKKVPP